VAVNIGNIEVGPKQELLVIAGPCVIESWETIFNTATAMKDLSKKLGFQLVFKASFDKANRTSYNSFRGPGLEVGLEMLAQIKRKLGLPVLSDVHEASQCAAAGEVLDVIQIPAFLCRQTDLVVEAARTMKAVNIKKGQFVSPLDILHSVKKVTAEGNTNVMVTERGTTFGYNNLVVDMRSIPMIQEEGIPLIFDATHSVQLPSAAGGISGGQRQYIPMLTRAAIAAGAQGLFMEVHPNPDEAQSDSATQVPLSHVESLLNQCIALHKQVQSFTEVRLPEKGQCGAQPAFAQ
jgi:2-dehydro-3-deoxyphosphooctonate aldolase (KDO 8-P synthase)